jgi:hypothetical protein
MLLWVLATMATIAGLIAPSFSLVSAALGPAFAHSSLHPFAPFASFCTFASFRRFAPFCTFVACLLFAVSRHMFRWRMHRPRTKPPEPRSCIARTVYTFACSLRTVFRMLFVGWLALVATGITLNCTWSALGLRAPALHLALNPRALHAFSLHSSKRLPNIGLPSWLSDFVAYRSHAYSYADAQSAFLHPFAPNTSTSSCHAVAFQHFNISASAQHLQPLASRAATAHACITPTQSFSAFALNPASSSSQHPFTFATFQHLRPSASRAAAAHPFLVYAPTSKIVTAFTLHGIAPGVESTWTSVSTLPSTHVLAFCILHSRSCLTLCCHLAHVYMGHLHAAGDCLCCSASAWQREGQRGWRGAQRCGSAAGGAALGAPWQRRARAQSGLGLPHISCGPR